MICPSSNYSKKERIKILFQNAYCWINSEPINRLITLFGGEIHTMNFSDRIKELNDFVNVWDYRKKLAEQQLVNERWNISDDDFVNANETIILQLAAELGLVHAQSPAFVPTHILPLGGARFSNLHRVKLVKELVDENEFHTPTKIVALSGMRPINEKERSSIDTYAPEAVTEYDAINAGLEAVFSLGKEFWEDRSDHTNPNLNSCVRNYEKTYRGISISSMAAPSRCPDRRADSRDTFEYFLSRYNIDTTSSVLLVTSQIYVPYQLLKFADLAIEGGFNVECIGTQMNNSALRTNASNYLQEIKAAVNAIYSLFQKYANEI